MIWSAIIFLAGAYCGHVISPWIDGQIEDFKKRMDRTFYDDPRADERNDWREL